MTAEITVIGVSRLDDHVLLADAGLAMAMVSAGAQRLIDLRGETKPPGLPDQDGLILAAAKRLAGLADEGVQIGQYCQAGVSRTSAVAIAVMWALVATLVKTMTDTLTEFGVWGMFTHWPVYALAGAGLGAEVVHQTTLRVGPLSVSQPFLAIVNPIVSIALSVWIFPEHFTSDAGRLAVGAVAFTAMCGSVVVLARTAPPTMSAHSASPDDARERHNQA